MEPGPEGGTTVRWPNPLLAKLTLRQVAQLTLRNGEATSRTEPRRGRTRNGIGEPRDERGTAMEGGPDRASA
jgi:hypothetical protein